MSSSDPICPFFARLGGFDSTPTVKWVTVNFKPATPEGLVATADDTWVLLQWDRVNAADVAGYEIFRNDNLQPLATVSQTAVGVNPSHRDLALTNGRSYSYRIRAFDTAGNRSELSTSDSATPTAGEEWGQ